MRDMDEEMDEDSLPDIDLNEVFYNIVGSYRAGSPCSGDV
jgi:hypothetical protein